PLRAPSAPDARGVPRACRGAARRTAIAVRRRPRAEAVRYRDATLRDAPPRRVGRRGARSRYARRDRGRAALGLPTRPRRTRRLGIRVRGGPAPGDPDGCGDPAAGARADLTATATFSSGRWPAPRCTPRNPPRGSGGRVAGPRGAAAQRGAPRPGSG